MDLTARLIQSHTDWQFSLILRKTGNILLATHSMILYSSLLIFANNNIKSKQFLYFLFLTQVPAFLSCRLRHQFLRSPHGTSHWCVLCQTQWRHTKPRWRHRNSRSVCRSCLTIVSLVTRGKVRSHNIVLQTHQYERAITSRKKLFKN